MREGDGTLGPAQALAILDKTLSLLTHLWLTPGWVHPEVSLNMSSGLDPEMSRLRDVLLRELQSYRLKQFAEKRGLMHESPQAAAGGFSTPGAPSSVAEDPDQGEGPRVENPADPEAEHAELDQFSTPELRESAILAYLDEHKCTRQELARTADVHYTDLNKWKLYRSTAKKGFSKKAVRIEDILKTNQPPLRET